MPPSGPIVSRRVRSGSTLPSRAPSTAATLARSRPRTSSIGSRHSGSLPLRRPPAVSLPSPITLHGETLMPDPDSLYQLPTLVRREMRRLASLLLFELLGLTLLANVVWTQSLALRWGARDSLFGRPILRLSAYPSWP